MAEKSNDINSDSEIINLPEHLSVGLDFCLKL